MGYSLAKAAAGRGHEVVLVSGPVSLPPPSSVRTVRVRSAAEMLEACLADYAESQATLLAAAVADYRPVWRSPHKLKKSQAIVTLELERTEDIARHLGQSKGSRVLVGFALESEQGRVNAERKLADKNLDAICLNGPETFGAERIRAEILERGQPWRTLEPTSKSELARIILDLVERRASTV
jgi:phosphopantothenoylcysteine decarboxylase/phosphopantothenate--cysteine ligase